MKDAVLMFYLYLCGWYEWMVTNAHKAVRSLPRQLLVRNVEKNMDWHQISVLQNTNTGKKLRKCARFRERERETGEKPKKTRIIACVYLHTKKRHQSASLFTTWGSPRSHAKAFKVPLMPHCVLSLYSAMQPARLKHYSATKHLARVGVLQIGYFGRMEALSIQRNHSVMC